MIIAAAQFTPAPGDVRANARTMDGLVRTAAGQGGRVVVFAELALTGYELGLIAKDPGLWVTEGDPRLDPVREACRDTSTAAVVNCAARKDGARPTITSLVFGPDGELLTRYDKQHVHKTENDVFTAGATDGRFTLDGVRFALAICYDNRFPELAERARTDNCQVYVASSALDVENDSFETLYPVRARDNGLYVILGNAVGLSDAGDCRGGSAVWGPDGAVLADAGTATPGLAMAELPL
ncbi:carbon-nitrogen hydrolase family protein [Streptomyces sp. NBC_01142]|uniref:carbon-nitrogen hydrolase family protein n=1 Tax=Streptomyces sp. NBC_01142 TaxID=2975865 RepID=UPI00224DCBCB|nr:carbon-nitrogen hydrolase family protein [Streptomyces sp. NBC_01142]MCX4822867.1 carbon-nitrogen hydrolase family protein [Streptomyces sp. NBC_01142]